MEHEVVLRSGRVEMTVPYDLVSGPSDRIDALVREARALADAAQTSPQTLLDGDAVLGPLAAAARLAEVSSRLRDALIEEAAATTLVPVTVIAEVTGMGRETISRRTSTLRRIDGGRYRHARAWQGRDWPRPAAAS